MTPWQKVGLFAVGVLIAGLVVVLAFLFGHT
jgi:hypothetical protein